MINYNWLKPYYKPDDFSDCIFSKFVDICENYSVYFINHKIEHKCKV